MKDARDVILAPVITEKSMEATAAGKYTFKVAKNAEKIEIAKCLERMKVDIIEAGFAISSPGDFESVQSIAREIKGCTIASLARSTEGDIDAAWNAVKDAADPRILLFIATSPLHMEYKLKMKPERPLELDTY